MYHRLQQIIDKDPRSGKSFRDAAKEIGIHQNDYSEIYRGLKEEAPMPEISYPCALKLLKFADGRLRWDDLPGWDWRKTDFVPKIASDGTLLDIMLQFLYGRIKKLPKKVALYFLLNSGGRLEWEDLPGYDWKTAVIPKVGPKGPRKKKGSGEENTCVPEEE